MSRRQLLRGRFLAGLLGGAVERVREPLAPLLPPPATEPAAPPLVGRPAPLPDAAQPEPSRTASDPARPTAARDGPTSPHTALVDPLLCLAHRGTTCTVCIERCPEPGALRVVGRGPRVDPRACTGCRVCQDVCPAPANAVRLLPRMPLPGGPHAIGPLGGGPPPRPPWAPARPSPGPERPEGPPP